MARQDVMTDREQRLQTAADLMLSAQSYLIGAGELALAARLGDIQACADQLVQERVVPAP